MNIAIVGAGIIGNKRAKSLSKDDKLISICDVNLNSAKRLAQAYSAQYTNDIKDIALDKKIDSVIIAVTNKYLMPISILMLENNKNVLCEKPLGRNFKESVRIVETANKYKKLIKTGFNHRFHPAVIKTKSVIESGDIGEIMNIRGVYGHGGRTGMENEWRCSKDLCGGGELLDQGVHLIDLINFFTDQSVTEVFGNIATHYWDIEVEDNVFFTLKTKKGIIAQCHASWTNWKNKFSFDIFGTKGYISINGLGGSYGIESLDIGLRKTLGSVPDIKNYTYDVDDKSWN